MNESERPLQRSKISEKDLFLKLLTAPREAFKFINDYKYEKHLYLLLFLAGIVRAFDRAASKNMGDQLSLLTIVGLSVIFGGLFGWLSYYLYAWLVSWTGGWLNGKANTQSIIRVFAYSFSPSVFILILLIPQLTFYGHELFTSDNDLYDFASTESILLYLALFIESSLGIWSLVLCVIGISEVQQLSIGKAIVNVIFPAILFVLAILVFIFLVEVLQ